MDLTDALQRFSHSIQQDDPSHQWYEAADVVELLTKEHYIVMRCHGCPLTKRKQHG
jgi:hypothetical protein